LRRVVVATLLATMVGVGIWLALDPERRTSLLAWLEGVVGEPSPSPSPSSEPAPAPVASSPAPTSSPSTGPTVEPTATASSRAEVPEVGACVRSLFPEGTFPDRPPELDWICTQSNARRGGTALRVAVVRAGARGVTQGMREWAELGWYEMAAFVLAASRCCSSPPPLATKPAPKSCKLDASLNTFRDVALGGDQGAIDRSLDAFDDAVICIVRKGAAGPFGQRRLPGAQARDVFQRTLDRARRRPGP
jgi:hypothetical protein